MRPQAIAMMLPDGAGGMRGPVVLVAYVMDSGSVMGPRMRIGRRESDHAGKQDKRRDEFLLHHHSTGYIWPKRP
jgi:hypothetical protein